MVLLFLNESLCKFKKYSNIHLRRNWDTRSKSHIKFTQRHAKPKRFSFDKDNSIQDYSTTRGWGFK